MKITNLINKVSARIFGSKIGTDDLGNEYFAIKWCTREFNRKRRIVIYDLKRNPDMHVHEDWHNWLRYMTNDTPNEQSSHIPRIKSKSNLYHRRKKHYTSWP